MEQPFAQKHAALKLCKLKPKQYSAASRCGDVPHQVSDESHPCAMVFRMAWNPRRKKDAIDEFLRQKKPDNAVVVWRRTSKACEISAYNEQTLLEHSSGT
jgi:hypothetical protein